MPGRVGWNMENDKQINNSGPEHAHDLERTKRFFLSEELLSKSQKPEVYSLADEYAKSKRNKNFLVYFLIFSYIAAIGIGVFFIDKLEENRNKRIEVNIAEFRQFNLMELLMEQKENEEKLAKLQQELEDLRISSKKELEKLSPHSQQKVLAAANEKIKKLEEAYNQEIKARQEAINSLQKTIAAEKQKIVANTQNNKLNTESANKNPNISTLPAQIQEAAIEKVKAEYEAKMERLKAEYETKLEKEKAEYLANTNKLNEEHRNELNNLKKQNEKLADTLTLRYNPIYSQGEMASIINSRLGNSGNGSLNKYAKLLADENIFSEQEFNTLRNKIRGQGTIIDNLSAIPYVNSVPPALNRLNRLTDSIITDYETLWSSLVQRLKEKNDLINGYNFALSYLSTTRGENGYVIDARDSNRLIVFINHSYSVKKGDIGFIYKNEDMAIAKIEFIPEKGRVTARVVSMLRTEKIEPFDKILLKIEVSQ